MRIQNASIEKERLALIMFESLHVNDKSGVPVWIQIRNHILFLIKTEQIGSGDILPTVRELATRLGVNYNTIHKVYQDLETDGVICTSRGKRSFVADVDRNVLHLPKSPVDVVIDELVRVARESNVAKEDVLFRVEEHFAKDDI
jgi:GntR family transcriptional regulator